MIVFDFRHRQLVSGLSTIVEVCTLGASWHGRSPAALTFVY